MHCLRNSREENCTGKESNFLNTIEFGFDLSKTCWVGPGGKNVFHKFKKDLKHKH